MDYDGYEKVLNAARKTQQLVIENRWKEATDQWGNTQIVVLQESKGVDFYNIARPSNLRFKDIARLRFPTPKIKQGNNNNSLH